MDAKRVRKGSRIISRRSEVWELNLQLLNRLPPLQRQRQGPRPKHKVHHSP